MNSQNITQTKGETSKIIYERAVEVLTGGVSRNTIFRKPHPYYVASANGSYITDIDGTARVDFDYLQKQTGAKLNQYAETQV